MRTDGRTCVSISTADKRRAGDGSCRRVLRMWGGGSSIGQNRIRGSCKTDFRTAAVMLWYGQIREIPDWLWFQPSQPDVASRATARALTLPAGRETAELSIPWKGGDSAAHIYIPHIWLCTAAASLHPPPNPPNGVRWRSGGEWQAGRPPYCSRGAPAGHTANRYYRLILAPRRAIAAVELSSRRTKIDSAPPAN